MGTGNSLLMASWASEPGLGIGQGKQERVSWFFTQLTLTRKKNKKTLKLEIGSATGHAFREINTARSSILFVPTHTTFQS